MAGYRFLSVSLVEEANRRAVTVHRALSSGSLKRTGEEVEEVEEEG